MKALVYIIIGIILVVSAVPLAAQGTVSTIAPPASPVSPQTGNGTAMVYFIVNGTGLSPSDKVAFQFTGTHVTVKTANQWYFEINESVQELLYFEPHQSMNVSIESLSSLPILYVNMSAKTPSIEMNSILFHGSVKQVSFSIPIMNVTNPNGNQVPVGGNTSITVDIGKPSKSTGNTTGTGNTTPIANFYLVTFEESGLPRGMTWETVVDWEGSNGTVIVSPNDTTSSSFSKDYTNGTYTVLIFAVASWYSQNYTANQSRITFTVNGANMVFHIKFTEQTIYGLTHLDIGIILLVSGTATVALALKRKKSKKKTREEQQPTLSNDILFGQQAQEHSQDEGGRDQDRSPDQPGEPQEPEEGKGEDMEREETDEFSKYIREGR